jgi:A/G-specific adenine glycosylase
VSNTGPDRRIPRFVALVLARGEAHYRDFPWRHTRDPYEVLVSEVMLQQTQVARVVPYWGSWLEDFPTLEALAAAPLEAVLRAWQGLGYNRRALALKRLAEEAVALASPEPARLPPGDGALRTLPGVGPATAAGVRAFAFGEPAAYLETNVRSVFLHELFADADGVPDREIAPLVEQAAGHADSLGVDARTWNHALLDYGAHLKQTRPNPSRRSAHHTRQSVFEGSTRQKRARILRLVLELPGVTAQQAAEEIFQGDEPSAAQMLESLAAEGFIVREGDGWRVC